MNIEFEEIPQLTDEIEKALRNYNRKDIIKSLKLMLKESEEIEKRRMKRLYGKHKLFRK